MKTLSIILAIIVVSLSAQDREFPLSKSDYPAYFDLLGSRRVLMSVNKVIEKVTVTYGQQRAAMYTVQAVTLASYDASLDPDSSVLSGVQVFTDRYGLVRVKINIQGGTSKTYTMNELVRRRNEYLTLTAE